MVYTRKIILYVTCVITESAFSHEHLKVGTSEDNSNDQREASRSQRSETLSSSAYRRNSFAFYSTVNYPRKIQITKHVKREVLHMESTEAM